MRYFPLQKSLDAFEAAASGFGCLHTGTAMPGRGFFHKPACAKAQPCSAAALRPAAPALFSKRDFPRHSCRGHHTRVSAAPRVSPRAWVCEKIPYRAQRFLCGGSRTLRRPLKTRPGTSGEGNSASLLTKIGPEDFFTDPLAQGLHPNCVWSALYPGRWLRPNRAAGALSFGFPLALAPSLHPLCVNDLPSALEQPHKGAPVRTSPARF